MIGMSLKSRAELLAYLLFLIQCKASFWNIPFLIPSNMKIPILLIASLLVLVSPHCVEYQFTSCIRCNSNQTLLDGTCIPKIPGCEKYQNATVCLQCNPLFFFLNGTTCSPVDKTPANISIAAANITLIQLAAFGNYQVIETDQLPFDTGFNQCNKVLRSGEYQHFISRTAQPVFFVAVSTLQSWRNYEIIYLASGGGLLMCLVNFDTVSSAVLIRSIVSIGTSQIVDNCLSYTTSLQCNYCRPNYHIQSGKCYPNIQGCNSYYRSFCLSCEGFALLVENRCITDCGDLCDLAKVPFYGAKL